MSLKDFDMRVVFLTLTTFTTKGGIEKVCAIFAKVLSDLARNGNIKPVIISAYDQTADCDIKYCNKDSFTGTGGNKLKFMLTAVRCSLAADYVVLSHVNLLLPAYIIKLFSPKTKIVLFAHGIEIWRELPGWKKNFLKDKCDFIWAVSEYTAKVIQERHGVDRSKIMVVNNCLDPYLEAPLTYKKPDYLLQRYGLNDKQPVIFTLARLSSSELYKGYDLVLQTVADLLIEFPDLIYLIGGKADRAEIERLNSFIEKLSLEHHVKLIGYLDDIELNDHFLLSDVFVMPSRKEGFGIVFIEAAALGCKVVGGNQDGTIDALLNGKLGKLINPGDIKELRNAIFEQLKSPKTKEVSESIRTLCLQNFSYKNYLQTIEKLLRSA